MLRFFGRRYRARLSYRLCERDPLIRIEARQHPLASELVSSHRVAIECAIDESHRFRIHQSNRFDEIGRLMRRQRFGERDVLRSLFGGARP